MVAVAVAVAVVVAVAVAVGVALGVAVAVAVVAAADAEGATGGAGAEAVASGGAVTVGGGEDAGGGPSFACRLARTAMKPSDPTTTPANTVATTPRIMLRLRRSVGDVVSRRGGSERSVCQLPCVEIGGTSVIGRGIGGASIACCVMPYGSALIVTAIGGVIASVPWSGAAPGWS